MTNRWPIKTLFIFIPLLYITSSKAEEVRPFLGFWQNAAESFSGQNAYLHLTAFALTPVLIKTGADAKVHKTFNENERDWIYQPGNLAGNIGPLLLGVPLLLHGKINNNEETLGASYAVAQSTVLSLSYISLLKAFTGRPPPDNKSKTSIQEQSEDFHFGFLRKGIVWGWPSGHVGVTTALATTLTHYYPGKTWVKYASYGSVAYMFLTVSAHNDGQMHWFSDGVAGLLVGFAIGSTVGSNFRSYIDKDQNKSGYNLLPILGRDKSGLQVVWPY